MRVTADLGYSQRPFFIVYISMSKKFSAELLSINGDNILLSSDSADTFAFKKSDGTEVFSNTSIDAAVSSLTARDSGLDIDISSLAVKDNSLDTDISSLVAKDNNVDTEISSLAAKDGVLDVDVSSLAAKDTGLDTDVSSLAEKDGFIDTDISSLSASVDSDISSLAFVSDTENVYATQEALGNGVASYALNWSSEYTPSTNPAVVATLRSSDANDPIIAVQISGAASTTGATFVFSDDLPSANYTLDVLASV